MNEALEQSYYEMSFTRWVKGEFRRYYKNEKKKNPYIDLESSMERFIKKMENFACFEGANSYMFSRMADVMKDSIVPFELEKVMGRG